jgi:hypothetical protein
VSGYPAHGYAAHSPSITSAPYSVPPVAFAPSIAPVTSTLGDDFDPDMLAMRPKRRAGKIAAGVAVLAVGGLGFGVVSSGMSLPRLNLSGGSSAHAAALTLDKASEASKPAAAPTPKVDEPKVEPAKPEPASAAAAVVAASATGSGSTGANEKAETAKADARFSEEMKEALLNKDKKLKAQQKTKKARVAAVTKRSGNQRKPSGGAIRTGGSAYDPLNGKL